MADEWTSGVTEWIAQWKSSPAKQNRENVFWKRQNHNHLKSLEIVLSTYSKWRNSHSGKSSEYKIGPVWSSNHVLPNPSSPIASHSGHAASLSPLLWADVAKEMKVLLSLNSVSGAMVSPWEGQAASISVIPSSLWQKLYPRQEWLRGQGPPPTLTGTKLCYRQGWPRIQGAPSPLPIFQIDSTPGEASQ